MGVSEKSKSERGSEKTPFIECMHSRKSCEDLTYNVFLAKY